jgi:ATP-dependent exoDNAse (exonuclease V) beta subunit
MIKWNKRFEYPTSTRSLVSGSRHYDVGQEKLPSVTTILSATQSEEKKASLERWKQSVGMEQATRIKDQAAARGTTMHSILEDYINGSNRVDMTENGILATSMAQQIIEKGLSNVDEVWGSEITVYYPGLYAGATDLVGLYKKSESIMDFKQSNKPKRREWIEDYKLQLAGYALAHNEVYGTNIQSGVVLMCTKDNYFQEFVFEGTEFRQAKFDWLRRVDQYYNQKQG